jgi:hypothetical protein
VGCVIALVFRPCGAVRHSHLAPVPVRGGTARRETKLAPISCGLVGLCCWLGSQLPTKAMRIRRHSVKGAAQVLTPQVSCTRTRFFLAAKRREKKGFRGWVQGPQVAHNGRGQLSPSKGEGWEGGECGLPTHGGQLQVDGPNRAQHGGSSL